MSEQNEADGDADAGTSLEEMFNSREFGRASGTTGAEGVAGIADLEQVNVTKEFGLATRFAAPVLQGSAVAGLNDAPFEDVLHSSGVGPPLALVSPLRTGPPAGVAVAAEDAAVAPPDIPRPYRNGHRVVAAVSGIAAAALVVAGVTSGTVQRRPSEVSAQGAHRTAASQGFGPSSGAGSAVPSGTTPTATLSAVVGEGAGSSARESDSPLPPCDASGGGVIPSGPAATSGTAVPSPTPSGAPTGGNGAPGSPPPPLAASNPVTTVTTAVASTGAGAGPTVTTVANQLGSSVPPAAPATNAVGTVMGGIGQTVDLTMG